MNIRAVISQDYEIKLFRYGLILGLVFTVIRLALNLSSSVPSYLIAINLSTLVVLGLLHLFGKYSHSIAIFIFHFLILIAVSAAWAPFGGWDGRVPYTLIVVSVFIVATSHEWQLLITMCALVLTILYADQSDTLSLDQSLLRLEFEFVFNTTLLVLLTLYLKLQFFKKKQLTLNTINKLQRAKTELAAKQKFAQTQKEELERINDEVQEIMRSKALELNQKVREIKKHRWSNSHILRAPIARLMATIELMETEQGIRVI